MSYEMSSSPDLKQEKAADEGEKNLKKKSKLKGALGAAVLAGAMTYAPDGMAQKDVEGPEPEGPTATEVEEKQPTYTVNYSDYIKVNRLPVDKKKMMMGLSSERAQVEDSSLKLASEQALDTRVKSAKEGLRVDEALAFSRENLRKALGKIAQETGADANPVVQAVGSAIVNFAIKQVDFHLSEKMKSAVIKGMSESDAQTLDFIASGSNAENMMFTKELGKKDGWKLTLGVDPGISVGSKVDPKVGVTFRMKLP